jgi:hypothetical protein
MVYITSTGEMLPDTDPRAIAARGGARGGGNRSSTTRRGGFGSVHSSNSSTSSNSNSTQASSSRGGGGPLNSLAKMMGIENKFLDTPALGTILPTTRVPYVYLVVLAVLTFFAGIRALIVSVVVWYIYNHQQATMPAPPTAPTR